MFKFGNSEPRSLNSFGISGLLDEECKIFYEAVFSHFHVGRVSDLLTARLREQGSDEFLLRSLLLLNLFEAYRSQISKSEWDETSNNKLSEPIVLECGYDKEKIAVGISFSLSNEDLVKVSGMAERIKNNTPEGGFETILSEINQTADRLVLRVQPSIRRYEIVTLLGLPGKIKPEKDNNGTEEIQKCHIVVMGTDPDQTPIAKTYIELGDLNYNALLKEEGKKLPETPSGKLIAQTIRGNFQEELSQKKVDGEDSTALQDAIKVRGSTNQDEKTVVAGNPTEGQDQTVSLVKGSENDHTPETVTRVSGGSSNDPQSTYQDQVVVTATSNEVKYHEEILKLQKTISELRKKLGEKESEIPAESPQEKSKTVIAADSPHETSSETTVVSSATQNPELEKETEKSIVSKIKNVFGFLKKKEEIQEEHKPEKQEESPTEKSKLASEEKEKNSSAPSEEEDEKEENVLGTPSMYAKDLSLAMEGGQFDQIVKQAQQHSINEKTSSNNPKAQQWVDGLVEGLVQEKSKIAKLVKKLNTSVKKKELDFATKERTLQEEIRRRDEQLKQKSNAISRAKDQISQLQMNMERVRSSGRGAGSEVVYKKKLEHTQLLLKNQQAEVEKMKKKLEETKGSLVTAKRGPSVEEYQNLEDKYHQTRVDLETQKKKAIMAKDQLDQSEKRIEKLVANEREWKTRLEKAIRFSMELKKEIENLKKKEAA